MKKVLLFLVAFFILFNIFTIDDKHNWGDDFSAYISQAKAIAERKIDDYSADADFRIAHSEIQVGPNLYPWGYPLILFPAIAFFGINVWILKLETYTFFVGSLVVLYFLFRSKIGEISTLILILIMASSPYFFIFKQNVLSDIPAMFFLLLSIFFIQSIYFENINTGRTRKTYLVLLGLSIFASVFIRANSFVLFPLLLLVQIIEYRRWSNGYSDIIFGTIPYLISAGLHMFTLLVFPISSYASHFKFTPNFILDTVIRNSHYYLVIMADFFGNAAASVFVWIIYFLSGIFFLASVFEGLKKNYLYILFILLTLGLFLIYPYQQGLRFIISLVPFYLFFAILGIRAVNFERILGINSGKIVYILSFSLVLFFTVQIFSLLDQFSAADGPYSENSKELFDYIRNNTANTETVSFFKPRAMYLFTERKSVRIDSVDFLKSSDVDYFVFTKDVNQRNTERYLNQNGILVFENGQFRVYDLR